ncbi:MAG: histidine triad nucleotide-binding protein [bacterium]|nr:histidine triad nucleotide-binding protein [bacterium]
MNAGCVFCKIVKGEIPARKVYEDKEVLAFHTTRPEAPVHVLVIPKKHITNLGFATQEDVQVLGECQVVCGTIAKELGIDGAFKVLSLAGSDAGQSVFHLHYHVMGG